MKNIIPIFLLVLAVAVSGCAWTKRQFAWHRPPAASKASSGQAQAIVTPDDSLSAKVLTVNSVGRFVVLNFSVGSMPRVDQHFFLYRAGLRTAEVRVVGPQQETSIVADIISGDAEPGDTVRAQ